MAVVTPDMPEIFEEAFERAGLEMRTGYDLKTARRSLNLLTLEWQNRGLNLFTIEAGTLAVTAGTATYTLPTDTIDIIEHQIRTGTGTNQIDTSHVLQLTWWLLCGTVLNALVTLSSSSLG